MPRSSGCSRPLPVPVKCRSRPDPGRPVGAHRRTTPGPPGIRATPSSPGPGAAGLRLAGTAPPKARTAGAARIGSVSPRGAGDALVHLHVPGSGGGHDVGWDVGAWRLAIPAGDAGGPVAQVLLVEVPLRSAGSPF